MHMAMLSLFSEPSFDQPGFDFVYFEPAMLPPDDQQFDSGLHMVMLMSSFGQRLYSGSRLPIPLV
jgi:hypothetical protein